MFLIHFIIIAIIRHFSSLRNMQRDGGLINMFLEEATNERMHLLTFVRMRDPSLGFRAAVIGSQFAFGSGFLLAYMLSPKFCHRFVGYVEEEACSTYTKIIKAIEQQVRKISNIDYKNWTKEIILYRKNKTGRYEHGIYSNQMIIAYYIQQFIKYSNVISYVICSLNKTTL